MALLTARTQSGGMSKPPKLTKAQWREMCYAIDARRMIEYDLHDFLKQEKVVPPAWDLIWKDKDRRDAKRTRITIALDADVVRFFKAMGEGYQARINRVLRAYMHYRLAGIIEGPDTTDYILRPESLPEVPKDRGEWGDFERFLGGETGE